MTSLFSNRKNTSIFTSNASRESSVINKNTIIVNSANENSFDLGKKFRTVLNKVNILNKYYSDGDFNSLESFLTVDRYSQISLDLVREKDVTRKDREIVRINAKDSLKGTQRSLIEHRNLLQATEHNEALQEKASILDDPTRLNEYIVYMNSRKTSSIFGDHTITSSIPASVSPVYLRYIELYGFPNDGIFDPDLLGTIGNIMS